MVEYVVKHNLDTRVLDRAVAILEQGGLVGIPTDTTWSVCCSTASRSGVDKLKALKGKPDFTPSILCAELAQWEAFTHLDTTQFRLVKRHVPGPFVFVFKSFISFEKKFGIRRPAVGLRIPDHPVPLALVRALGVPLFAGTASRRMADTEWWDATYAEENLYDAGWELEDIRGVDLILDPGEELPRQLSTVVDMSGTEPVLIRQGIGVFTG